MAPDVRWEYKVTELKTAARSNQFDMRDLSSRPRRAVTMSYMASDFRDTGTGHQPDYLRVSGQAPASRV
jgi:hypothetical protein